MLLLIALLATWRLTSLLARERGLFGSGTLVRRVFGVYHEADGTPARDENGDILLNPITPSAFIDGVLHEIAQGITCIWCCSVWVGAAVAIIIAPRLGIVGVDVLLLALALSAASILIEGVIEHV